MILLYHYERLWSLIDMRREVESVLEEGIKRRLAGLVAKDQVNSVFSKLLISKKQTHIVNYKKELLKIAVRYQQSGPDKKINNLINNLVNKYGWVTVTFMLGEPLIRQKVVQEIKQEIKRNPLKKLKQLEKRRKNELKETHKLLKELGLVDNKLIEMARRAIFVINRRAEIFFEGSTNLRGFLTEIGRRIGLSYFEVVQLTGDEIIESLKYGYKIDKKLIRERDKSNTVVMKNYKVKFYFGDQSLKFKNNNIDLQLKQIKGQTANSGRVKGRAIIVLSKKDFIKLKKGDILITPMTTPDFMPIIEKSAAVVTDIGGITSHASIISRELGIPCVVGTKIATQVLKDGELVEVDANKGIVRKLFRH